MHGDDHPGSRRAQTAGRRVLSLRTDAGPGGAADRPPAADRFRGDALPRVACEAPAHDAARRRSPAGRDRPGPREARRPQPGRQRRRGGRRRGRGRRGNGQRPRDRARAHRRERQRSGNPRRAPRETLPAVLLDQGDGDGSRAVDRPRDRGRARRHDPRRGQLAARLALRHRDPGDAHDRAGGGVLIVAGEHILIVDDEPAIQQALRGVLEDEGYRVTTVGSGADAVTVVADEMPDLVFLDIWMRGMDGPETLGALKRVRPDVAVVMISGHGTIETAVKATRLGAYDFIEKPLSIEKTLLSLTRALEHGRLERENARRRDEV